MTSDLPDIPLPRLASRGQQSMTITTQIQDFVRRMLSFDAKLRPSIVEVATTLESYSKQLPID